MVLKFLINTYNGINKTSVLLDFCILIKVNDWDLVAYVTRRHIREKIAFMSKRNEKDFYLITFAIIYGFHNVPENLIYSVSNL